MTMPAPIQFHFDFSSPYGYLGAEAIEALAARHGRTVAWHPFLLGVVFKSTGAQPLVNVPIKGDYAKRDMRRSARYYGVPFHMPSKFPIATQAPARITLWQRGRDADVGTLVKAFYRAYFVDDRDIGDPEVAAGIAGECGLDRVAARAAIDDPSIKDTLRREVEASIGTGVFGSPFVFVDGEPFWGIDRFEQVERWIAKGGF